MCTTVPLPWSRLESVANSCQSQSFDGTSGSGGIALAGAAIINDPAAPIAAAATAKRFGMRVLDMIALLPSHGRRGVYRRH